jgi:phosphoglycolate phosphatase
VPTPARIPRPCRALLLDLDGTLVDSAPDIATALGAVLAEERLEPFDLPTVRAMVGDGAPDLVRKAFARRGAPEPPDALARFRLRYDGCCLERTVVHPGMREALAQLAAATPPVPVSIVTNKPTAFARKVVEGLGLAPLVRDVVGPELVSARKPAAAHLVEALARLGVERSEAVVAGDGPTDLLAGRAAGIASVAVLWGYRSREELAEAGATAFVETPADLARLLFP